uniref:SWI/SNF-related matrix-associated actin-dependent regulator of chromatin subfamily B member 1 n=1 Tax=Haemonchus placei TaxID=6290 RepID=A0A0N4X5W2_HAEPC
LDPNVTDQRAIMKLNINVGNQSLVDQFEWDMSDPANSPEEFARSLCAELGLGGEFTSAIAYSIRGQLQWNQRTYAFSESPQPTVECTFRYVSCAPPLDPNVTDQRAIMKLNINVGNQSLVDQFEWDMSDPANSPEEFARSLCAELGLGGEFTSAIAYSIRGQLQWNQRTYAFSESPQPTVECTFRNPSESEAWGPFLETLTDAEIEKKMRDQDRNTRRMRRLVGGGFNF